MRKLKTLLTAGVFSVLALGACNSFGNATPKLEKTSAESNSLVNIVLSNIAKLDATADKNLYNDSYNHGFVLREYDEEAHVSADWNSKAVLPADAYTVTPASGADPFTLPAFMVHTEANKYSIITWKWNQPGQMYNFVVGDVVNIKCDATDVIYANGATQLGVFDLTIDVTLNCVADDTGIKFELVHPVDYVGKLSLDPTRESTSTLYLKSENTPIYKGSASEPGTAYWNTPNIDSHQNGYATLNGKNVLGYGANFSVPRLVTTATESYFVMGAPSQSGQVSGFETIPTGAIFHIGGTYVKNGTTLSEPIFIEPSYFRFNGTQWEDFSPEVVNITLETIVDPHWGDDTAGVSGYFYFKLNSVNSLPHCEGWADFRNAGLVVQNGVTVYREGQAPKKLLLSYWKQFEGMTVNNERSSYGIPFTWSSLANYSPVVGDRIVMKGDINQTDISGNPIIVKWDLELTVGVGNTFYDAVIDEVHDFAGQSVLTTASHYKTTSAGNSQAAALYISVPTHTSPLVKGDWANAYRALNSVTLTRDGEETLLNALVVFNKIEGESIEYCFYFETWYGGSVPLWDVDGNGTLDSGEGGFTEGDILDIDVNIASSVGLDNKTAIHIEHTVCMGETFGGDMSGNPGTCPWVDGGEVLSNFANNVLNTLAEPCANPDADNSAAVEAVWEDLKWEFEIFSGKMKETFNTSDDETIARARTLYSHIVTRYGLSTWEGATPVASATSPLAIVSNNATLIIVISSISLAAIALVLLKKKTKR